MQQVTIDDLVPVFGKRLAKAREISGINQIEAAKVLGYCNSSSLSKVESGFHMKSVDPLLAISAANAYQVSIDFLFGTSDQWQRDLPSVHREQAAQLLTYITQSQSAAIRELFTKLMLLSKVAIEINSRAAEIKEALHKFAAANPQFEDQPGSARLVRVIEQAKVDSKKLVQKLDQLTSH